ncbi:MAG: MerR family transcriptional regulator [Pseudomonadota bacterium]|nr:MerR family transcriptional regulator [Pseudomonadota bacterium]
MEKALPPIPAKRYFTIGEVSDLCGVKPYVLRYWEQEFTQLKPMKRRGNRRYYQHHEVLLIRRIRDLLYEQGFTISGARNRLTEAGPMEATVALGDLMTGGEAGGSPVVNGAIDLDQMIVELQAAAEPPSAIPQPEVATVALSMPQMREELESIRELLVV